MFAQFRTEFHAQCWELSFDLFHDPGAELSVRDIIFLLAGHDTGHAGHAATLVYYHSIFRHEELPSRYGQN